MWDDLQSDGELLRRFAGERSEAAFGAIVARHVALVYSAALRQTGGDAHLAQDVAQVVFTDLARKAPALPQNVILPGWLHRASVFAARQIMRTERRRQRREQEATTMETFSSGEKNENQWAEIRPLLDEALGSLSPADRDALLLRFFEQRSLAQVGERLGSNEDAARKRVDRALEKLRRLLARRGVTTTAATLAAFIPANAVQAAPAGLAAALTQSGFALAGTTASTFTLLNLMTATKIQIGVSLLVIAGATTVLVAQHQTQAQLRADNQSLQQQLTQLQNDNLGLSNRLAASDADKLSDAQLNELLRLRGELGVLEEQTNQLGRLNQELAEARVRASQPAAAPVLSPAEQQQQAIRDKLNVVKLTGLSLFLYMNKTGGQYPTNIEQAADTFTSPGQYQDFTNGYVLAYQGPLNQSELTNPATAIVISEQQPWSTVDGRWAKTYGFADGHAEIHVQNDSDFSAFEQAHAPIPTVGAQ